jgi:RHS repeat-associated protein
MKIRSNRLEPTGEAAVTVNNQPVSRYNEYFHKALGVDNTQEAVYEELHIVGVRKNAGPDGADVVTEETGHVFVPKTPEVFTHDADGNLTSDGRWTYTWDAENRLVGVETAVSAVTAGAPKQKLKFSYDFQSRRISKKVYEWNGASGEWQVAGDLRFIYDGWNLVVELDATLAPVRTHTWGLDLSGSEQGAGGVGGLLFTTTHAPAASTRFVSFDGNGNVSALLNVESGVTSAEYEYDPFGNTLRATGPAAEANPFRFSTKYLDSETGLYYYGYRYYQPTTGRWLSRDPIGDIFLESLYAFVGNIPNSSVDYLGLADVRLPSTSIGYFVGEAGNSQFLFKAGTEHARLFPKGIPFRNGFPDLSGYTANFSVAGKTVVADVKIPKSQLQNVGQHSKIGFEYLKGQLGPEEFTRLKKAGAFKYFSWHHNLTVQGRQLIFVPRALHEVIGHTGWAAPFRRALRVGGGALGKCLRVVGTMFVIVNPVEATLGPVTTLGDGTIVGNEILRLNSENDPRERVLMLMHIIQFDPQDIPSIYQVGISDFKTELDNLMPFFSPQELAEHSHYSAYPFMEFP